MTKKDYMCNPSKPAWEDLNRPIPPKPTMEDYPCNPNPSKPAWEDLNHPIQSDIPMNPLNLPKITEDKK